MITDGENGISCCEMFISITLRNNIKTYWRYLFFKSLTLLYRND